MTLNKIISSVSLLSVILAAMSISTFAAEKPMTFDGNIHNNSLSVSPDEKTAVVSISDQPRLVVYDLAKGKVRKIINGYVTPRNIVYAPSGNVFYVSDSSLGTINKIDAHNFKTLSSIPLGAGVFGTTLNKNGTTLYANNQASSTVSVINLANERTQSVITGFSQPRQGIRLSPDNSSLYVTNFLGDKITIVNTENNKIEGEITGFNKIRAISITADGKTLFAANSGANNIAVVDIDLREIVKTIPVGKEPYGAALAADGKHLYSGNLGDNTLSEIDLNSMQVTASIPGFKEPRQAIVFSKDSKSAYVLNVDLSLSKLDISTRKITQIIVPY